MDGKIIAVDEITNWSSEKWDALVQKDASIIVPMTATSNEQWKNGGDCTKCRRESYCRTLCTARKRKERKSGKTR